MRARCGHPRTLARHVDRIPPHPCACIATPQDACVLDAVITVVDAHHVTQHLDEVKPAGVVNEAGET